MKAKENSSQVGLDRAQRNQTKTRRMAKRLKLSAFVPQADLHKWNSDFLIADLGHMALIHKDIHEQKFTTSL